MKAGAGGGINGRKGDKDGEMALDGGEEVKK